MSKWHAKRWHLIPVCILAVVVGCQAAPSSTNQAERETLSQDNPPGTAGYNVLTATRESCNLEIADIIDTTPAALTTDNNCQLTLNLATLIANGNVTGRLSGCTNLTLGFVTSNVGVTSVPTTLGLSYANGAQQTVIVAFFFQDTDGKWRPINCGTPLTINLSIPPTTVNGSALFLWPPNHKYWDLSVAGVLAGATINPACAPSVDLTDAVVTRITSDEVEEAGKDDPTDSPYLGDGRTFCDAVIKNQSTDPGEFYLRSERAGKGDGRVYTIYYTDDDLTGEHSFQVKVAHDQGAPTTAVNSGVKYTVTPGASNNNCANDIKPNDLQ